MNEDPKDTMLREYQTEIERLRLELENRTSGTVRIIKKSIIKKIVKKKKNQIVEEEEDEESLEDDNPLSALDPETILRLQTEVEKEKQELMASKDMVIEEKIRISAELAKRSQDLEAEKIERENLAHQLRIMEAKLLIGGVHIEERVVEQEKELISKQEIYKQEEKKRQDLQKKIESTQIAQIQLEGNYSSLQEEVDIKAKKLQKMLSKLTDIKSEIADVEEEFRLEKEDILDTVRDLGNNLKLKMAIIEAFIPKKEFSELKEQVIYDEDLEDWKLVVKRPNRLERPISNNPSNRPQCKYAKMLIAMGDKNPRYRHDNILTLNLQFPPELQARF